MRSIYPCLIVTLASQALVMAAFLGATLAPAVARTEAQADAGNISAPTDPTNRTVQKLIEELDDDKFQKRDQATRELRKLGREIIPQLEAALKRPKSLEVQRRLERVLDWYRVRLEWYTDRAAFVNRLKNRVRKVDFDDIDTTKAAIVAFPSNHYEKKYGIVITGQQGQYVGRTFGFPDDYRPVSAPNMYAPGPSAKRDAGKGLGGYRTDVTFSVRGQPAVTVGFGVVFIDADYPDIGPSSLSAVDRLGKPLGDPKVVYGANASQVFCGAIAVDGAGNLLPSIALVRLVNGCNWPGVDAGEGVTLDDFVFADPLTAID